MVSIQYLSEKQTFEIYADVNLNNFIKPKMIWAMLIQAVCYCFISKIAMKYLLTVLLATLVIANAG